MSFNRLPKGSKVLVTGASGLLGSAVSHVLLASGYQVRGTTRSVAKLATLVSHFDSKYGKDSFEAVELSSAQSSSDYEKVLDGISGILHIANETSFAANYDQVVGSTIDSLVSVLEAASKFPEVKSVVLTSSRIAAFHPENGKDVKAGPDTYDTGHLAEMGKSLPEDHPSKPLLVYAASKIEGEKAAWRWYKEKKPHYAFNTVLPDYIAGPVFNPTPGTYSTSSILSGFASGDQSGLFEQFTNPASWIIDTRDVAAIHVAALLSDSTDGQRVWAAAHQFTANEVLSILREAYPQRNFREDFDYPQAPKIEIDNKIGTDLLEAFTGRTYYSTKETVLANVKDTLA